MTMQFHLLANLFPLMAGLDFKALKADIAANGQLEDIFTYKGLIMYGRNRYRACITLGIEPRMREWTGDGSPLEFILSANLHRRHLNPGQRAMLAIELEPLFAKEAKERQRRHGDTAPGRPSENTCGKNTTSVSRARDDVASLCNVSGTYVQHAKPVHEELPDLCDDVRAGKVTLCEAARLARKASIPRRVAAIPKGKFRILLADPPWQYGSSGSGLEQCGPAQGHYDTMSVEELCDLPIKEHAADDAVLFLWVPAPLLSECWPVIRAWSFRYRTFFVWDKVRHTCGNYNSPRAELLLVCTRGSCTPDVDQKLDSVQVIERTSKHSAKPKEFRGIIDTPYPHGRRLELFARTKAPGWEAWGNKVPEAPAPEQEASDAA